MKKTISVTIESLDSKDLKKVQSAKAAIRTLIDFAKDMKEVGKVYRTTDLDAHAMAEKSTNSKKATPAFSYFITTVDVDGLEEVLEKINETANQLEEHLQELTRKIYMSLANEKPQE